MSSGPDFPEPWSDRPGFRLTDDTTSGGDNCITVFTDGAIPAEGRWVRVEGVVRAHEYVLETLLPTDGPAVAYCPILEVDSPWSRLRKFFDGLLLRLAH